jgi:NADH-quinone oxidoreductase subunit H
MFFLVEWGNLYVIGALLTIMFLGGWQIPHVTDNVVLRAILEFVTFFVKAYGLALVAMWVRATLPRVRVDQLMAMCWRYFVPISFVNMIGVALWVTIWPNGNLVAQYLMSLGGLVLLIYFFRRVAFHLRRAQVRERGQLTFSPLS